jgi:hypothetical protein
MARLHLAQYSGSGLAEYDERIHKRIECDRRSGEPMGKEEGHSRDKGDELLRQMREDTGSKKHLDKHKVRAETALRRATEARNEQAFLAALADLGINPESDMWRTYLQGFRRLPPKPY